MTDELRKQTERVLTKMYEMRSSDGKGTIEAEVESWLRHIYGDKIQIGGWKKGYNEEGQYTISVTFRVMPIVEDVVIEITKCLTSVADDFDRDENPRPHVDDENCDCSEEMQ